MSKKDFEISGISSLVLHTGTHNFSQSAHLPPVYATSTFTFDNSEQGMRRFAGEEEGYIYSRWGNPTFKVAEEIIAALEAFQIKNKDGNALELKAFCMPVVWQL